MDWGTLLIYLVAFTLVDFIIAALDKTRRQDRQRLMRLEEKIDLLLTHCADKAPADVRGKEAQDI